MGIDLGTKLFEVLRKQRKYFIRTTDGNKIITNHILFNSYEEEALKIQKEISKENIKKYKLDPKGEIHLNKKLKEVE